MREKIIKIFRDIPSSVLLIIGFCLTMFVTMVSCEFIDRLIGNANEAGNNKYNTYYLSFTHSERIIEDAGELIYTYVEDSAEKIYFNDIYDIMTENGLDFCISNFVSIGESQETQRNATYIYTFDGNYPFVLQEGKLNNEQDALSVVIGESIKEYTEKIDGKDYLYINGNYYRVAGVSVNNETGGYDSSIYMLGGRESDSENYSEAEVEFQSDIGAGSTAEMLIYSEDASIVDSINKAKEKCEKNYPVDISVSTEETEYTEKNITNRIYENLNKIFLPILFLFCINGCYSISYLWIKARKYDIAVKYTFGYSKGQVYSWIIREMSVLIGISVTITMILKIIYDLLCNGNMMFMDKMIYNIAIIAGSAVVTLLVTSVGAYRYSCKVIPAEVLKEL